MTAPDLLPANLPTLPTAQLLARLSAEPGRAEMTVDPASPWVAGVIVRTPRLLLALHAVNDAQAQIIAVPRVAGLQGSGDAQLQALLLNAAPQDDGLYRAVPPPDVQEAGPPPLELNTLPSALPTAPRAKIDVPLVALWLILGVLSFSLPFSGMAALLGTVLFAAAAFSLVPLLRQDNSAHPLRTVSLVTGVMAVLMVVLASFNFIPALVFTLALVSVVTGMMARLGLGAPRMAAVPSPPPPSAETTPVTQALPAPQLQLIETTRAQLIEHLEVAERSGNPRDVFEAKQALEVHLPDVVQRWEALPSWRRRDDAPLRRTLERLGNASVPDTTTSELEWDATERFIEQKARAKGTGAGELTVRREPLTPPARTQDRASADHKDSGPLEEK